MALLLLDHGHHPVLGTAMGLQDTAHAPCHNLLLSPSSGGGEKGPSLYQTPGDVWDKPQPWLLGIAQPQKSAGTSPCRDGRWQEGGGRGIHWEDIPKSRALGSVSTELYLTCPRAKLSTPARK